MNLPAPYSRPYRHRFARAVLGIVIFAPLIMFAAPPAQSVAYEGIDLATIVQQVAVPAYINPTADPAAWAQLATSDPRSVGFVVANVLNGPDYVPAPEWASVIHNVSANGIKVFGYVDTGYLGTTGQRTRLGSTDSIDWMSQIERDVATWYAFYGSDLAGIFFDQAQNACGPIPDSNEWADQYRYLTDEVKRLHPGATTVDNPGVGVPQCYEDAADVIVTFEGSYASYVDDPSAANPYTPLSWDPVDPKKIWHIVYGAPDVATMSQTVQLSKTRSAGYVYVTNDVLANPYDELPAMDYWGNEQAIASALPTGELSPPSPPTTLDTVEVYGTRIDLDWERSQGNSAPVVGYDIYRDGVWLDSVGADTVTYSAVDLTPRTTYTFAVVARDAFGLTSEASNSLTARADQTYGDPRLPPDEFAATGTTFTSTSSQLGSEPSRTALAATRRGCVRRAPERSRDPAPPGDGHRRDRGRSRTRFDVLVLSAQHRRIGGSHSGVTDHHCHDSGVAERPNHRPAQCGAEPRCVRLQRGVPGAVRVPQGVHLHRRDGHHLLADEHRPFDLR